MLDWIGRFDNKSSVLLGLNLGMLALLLSHAPTFDQWTKLMWGTAILSLIALGLCFFSIYLSNFPRTTGPEDSFFYFGSITNMSCEDYQKEFSSRTDEQHLDDLLSQTHRNAQILTIKFEHLKAAYLMLLMGLIPWALTLLLFNTIPSST